MKNIFLILGIILILAISVIAFITVQKFMKDLAIDGCLAAGRLTFENEQGYQANTPDNFWYDFCMKEKGYK